MVEHLVHNERVKLQATLLNGLAMAFLVTGIVQNIFVLAKTSIGGGTITIDPSIAILFLPAGIVIHFIGIARLGALREKDAM